MAKKIATELEFLRWFYDNVDLGPADFDIKCITIIEFEKETKKKCPEPYREILEDYEEDE